MSLNPTSYRNQPVETEGLRLELKTVAGFVSEPQMLLRMGKSMARRSLDEVVLTKG